MAIDSTSAVFNFSSSCINATKHILVKTLTFQGHVTSSATWPFDSP